MPLGFHDCQFQVCLAHVEPLEYPWLVKAPVFGAAFCGCFFSDLDHHLRAPRLCCALTPVLQRALGQRAALALFARDAHREMMHSGVQ